MVKQEEYYNVNGTPTSYDDLFKKYRSQTDTVIKNKRYQQVDKPVSTSISTETNQSKLETNQLPTNSLVSTTFPVIKDGKTLDVKSTDEIQKNIKSGIEENRGKYNELNPQDFEKEVELVKNKEAELIKSFEDFEKNNEESLNKYSNLNSEINNFYKTNKQDLEWYNSFMKEYEKNEGRGYYSVDQSDGSVYYSDDFKRAQSIEKNLFPQLEKIQEKEQQAQSIGDELSSQQSILKERENALKDEFGALNKKGEKINKLNEQHNILLGKYKPMQFDKFNASEELSTMGDKFYANVLKAGDMISLLPAYINDFRAAIDYDLFMSQDEKKEYDSMTPQQQRIINQARYSGGLGDLGLGGVSGIEASEELNSKIGELESKFKNYETDITTAFTEGRTSEGVTRLFVEGVATIPSVIQAMIPVFGIPSLVAGSAAQAQKEAVEKGKKINLKQMAYSSAIGASEGLLEIVTQRIGRGVLKNMMGKSKEFVQKSMKEIWLGIAKETGAEGLSETGTLFFNKIAESQYYDDAGKFIMSEKKFDEFFSELGDTFLIGSFVGGKMSGTGAGVAVTRNAIGNRSLRKVLDKTKFTKMSDAFLEKSSSLDKINLARNKFTENRLDLELKTKVSDGTLTKEEADNIKNNFQNIRSAAEIADNVKIGDNLIDETVDLIQERKEVSDKIKLAKDNKALVAEDSKRLAEIDTRLEEISVENKLNITTGKVEGIVKGLENINVEIAKDQKQADQIAKDKNLDKKASSAQGFILQNRETGEQTIVINKDVAKADQAINVAAHELLHGVLFNTVRKNPEVSKNLSEALKVEINKIDTNILKDGKLKQRLDRYKNEPGEIQAEETITLFADAIASGDIKYEENVFTKIGDVVRRLLQQAGLTDIKFNNPRDVFNFIKDYNKSIVKGEFTKAQKKLTTQTATGKLVEGDKKIDQKQEVKLSKTESDNVQQIYEQQGADGIMDILNEYKPMVNNIVNKYQNVPGFDRQMLTDEIETGKRGIFDLVREYKPETGVPLAAYINKYISARSIEAANRVLKTEFEQDISEAKGVAVKEEAKVKVDKKEKVTKKVLSKEFNFDKKDKATTKAMKSKDFNMPDSYKSVKDITPELTAELFGVDPKQYVDPKKSLRKEDVIAARTFIRKNTELLYNLLPEALNEQGKSTGVRKLLLDSFYESTGVRKEAALGRSKQGSEIRIKKPFNKKKFLSAFGIMQGEIMKVKNQTQASGMVSALMNEVGKAMTNQAIKKNLDTTQQKDIQQKIDDGKSRILYSVDGDKDTSNNLTEQPLTGIKAIKDALAKIDPKLKKLDFKNDTHVEIFTDIIINEFTKLDIPITSILKASNVANAGYKETSRLKKGMPYTSSVLQKIREAASRIQKTLKGKAKIDRSYQESFKSKGYTLDMKKNNKKHQESRLLNKKGIENSLKQFSKAGKNKKTLAAIASLFGLSSSANKHFVRNWARPAGYDIDLIARKIDEHLVQNNIISGIAFSEGIINGHFKEVANFIDKVYIRVNLRRVDDKKVTDGGFKDTQHPLFIQSLLDAQKNRLPNGAPDFSRVIDPLIRYFNPDVNTIRGGINPFKLIIDGKSVTEKFNIDLPKNLQTPGTKKLAQDLIYKQIIGEITAKEARAEMNSYVKLNPSKKSASDVNVKYAKSNKKDMSNKEQMERMKKIDKALKVARDPNAPEKGISIFDFDQTLANTKEKVVYTMPDGKQGTLTAKEFAEKAEQLGLDGAEFDFKAFEKVKGATKGPFFEIAQKIKGKYGNKDIFILTARPQSSDIAIQAFLKGIGLDIKLENITGLEDGSPQAKADFVIDKVADGYNNFFFGDDAYKNVKAVQEVLDEVDVKRDVQQAKADLYESIDTKFDKIIEENTGLDRNATVSIAKAKAKGAKRGNWFRDFFIPPSAEDFTGLLYNFIGKGKKGEADFKFFKDVLIRPFARGIRDLNAAKQVIANEYASLKKTYPDVVKSLRKESNVSGYNNSHAIRVYLWNKNGIPIPGLSKADETALIKHVKNNPDMKVYADQVGAITKLEEGYTTPSNEWMVGNISTDMLDVSNKIKRSEYLKEWKDNYEKMFTPERLNKIELIYGTKVIDALKDMQYRMEYGTNRSKGQDKITMAWQNWVNNSVGAIMFFNMRSAVLQTISSINFVNWSDNNPMKAAKALANQKQYWKDFSFIFNHPTLKQRRAGLDIDVNASEIAARVTDSKNPISAGLNYLLQIGFTPTRIADSFAIASGGAMFYRNRVNTYLKQGLNKKQAEEKAFLDFQEISEATQQSARPDMISQQQAGPLGRLVLAFQVTPMQYARLMKRSVQDLVAGRGDTKTHISKILYYGAVQNIMFNALQQAAFALAFADDEEDEEDKMTQAQKKKATRVMNGMADSILRGLGVQGAAVATIKNMIIKFLEQEKRGYRADHAYTMIEGLNISPPIGSKARKVYSATQTYKFNRDAIKQMGFDINNPAYEAVGNVVSGTTNVPLDRVVSNINNIRGAMDKNNAAWQRISMLLGWNRWDVNVPQRELEKVKKDIKKKKAEERKRKKNKK